MCVCGGGGRSGAEWFNQGFHLWWLLKEGKSWRKSEYFVRKRRVGKKDKNYWVRILAHDNMADLCQIEIIGDDRVGTEEKRIGALRKLGNYGI